MRPGIELRDDAIHVTGKAALADTIAALEGTAEAYRVPLFQAAYAGALTLAMVRDAPTLVPKRLLHSGKPALVVLCDDHPGAAGPDGWRQARKLLRWAGSAVFHATGGKREHYEMICAQVAVHRRVLLVEMELRHHRAWMAAAQQSAPRLPLLHFVPPPGGRHPVATPSEAIH